MTRFSLPALVCVLLLAVIDVKAAVLTFEEVTIAPGQSPNVSTIGDFSVAGDNRIWNTETTGQEYLSASPYNVGLIPKQQIISFSLSSGDLFNFQGSTISTSHADGSFVQAKGWRDGQDIYTFNMTDANLWVDPSGGTPRFFDLNWLNIDTVTFTWTGSGTICCAAGNAVLDNFTYTVVPIPATAWLFISGLFWVFSLAKKKTVA